MTLWVLKGGERGERESRMMSASTLAIGWEELPNLNHIKTKEELRELYNKCYPQASDARARNHVGQIFAFLHTARIGDLVVVPLKSTSSIAIGEISGDYVYSEELGKDMLHRRSVNWIKKDLPRSKDIFGQDLLYTFGAFLTFSKAERNNAEERVKAIIAGKKIAKVESVSAEAQIESGAPDVEIDIEQISEDQIREIISKKFRGHELSALIASILEARGFTTRVSPPGADGGVDILASPGVLGFGEPRICVQVKSSDSPVDVKVYRELKGTMDSFKASYGILVSWGGFKDTVRKEAQNDSFKIQLWDSGTIIDELLKNYEKLSVEIKAEMPLKRIWIVSEIED